MQNIQNTLWSLRTAFFFSLFAFYIQASHLVPPERLDFQLPCYYRDYYSQIDPLRFTEEGNEECPKVSEETGGGETTGERDMIGCGRR